MLKRKYFHILILMLFFTFLILIPRVFAGCCYDVYYGNCGENVCQGGGCMNCGFLKCIIVDCPDNLKLRTTLAYTCNGEYYACPTPGVTYDCVCHTDCNPSASSECNGHPPGSQFYDNCGVTDPTIIIVNAKCDSNCIYSESRYECSSNRHTECQEVSCGGKIYYCTQDGGTWKWRTSSNPDRCGGNLDGCYPYDNGCEIRDYYCQSGSCTYSYSNRNPDYTTCGGSNRCGESVGDTRYLVDYSCSNENCVKVGETFIEDCRCDASDSDGGKEYSTKGTCTDYTGCLGGICQSNSYQDYCIDSTTLREFFVSGSGDNAYCYYEDKSCSDLGSGYTCSDGKCTTSPLTCERANPSVTISPSSQSGSAGSTLTYTVEVTNNDNQACGSSTFSLSVTTCPSEFTCSLSKTSVTISPGITDSSTTISVTSPSTASKGTYTFKVKATNSGATDYFGEGSANYVIDTGGGIPQVDCKHSYSCSCTNWQNAGCTGDGKMKQVRDCTPDGCLSEERIVDDYSCFSVQTYKCFNGNAKDCSATGCPTCGCASGYVCENGVCNKYEYYTPTCYKCEGTISCPSSPPCGNCCYEKLIDGTVCFPYSCSSFNNDQSSCQACGCSYNQYSDCNICGCPQGGTCLANGQCKKLVDSYTPGPCADQSKCPDSTCYDNYCQDFGGGKFYCVATPTNWYVTTRDDYCDSNGCLRDWNGDGSKNNMDIYCSGFCSPPPESTAREEDRLEKARWGQDNNRDACIYCGGGKWISDSSRFESGTTYYCCGNNAGEYYLYRKSSVCDISSDSSDVACCDAATDCVWNGRCYSSGSYHPTYSECVYCSSGTWVSKQCGEHCRSLVGICSGGYNCWTRLGYQNNCPYLNCIVPDPPSGYIRSWNETNCGRTCTWILNPYSSSTYQNSVCSLTRCENTNCWTMPSATWSVTYPKSPQEHTYKAGETIEIKATISVSPSGFTPLLECKLNKFNGNNEPVGGILFNSWVKAPFPREITFNYKIKPNCEFCEKYHGATCSNCLGSDQSYGSQTKACWKCDVTNADDIAKQLCKEGCDPSGYWVIDYCKLQADFPENQGWNLIVDDTDRNCCVSTLVVPG
jgi:hypothetical protein